MLDEIHLKLRMNSSIFNGIMMFNELHKVTSGIMWHQFGSTIIDLIIIKVICSKVSMSLIFNDHIMQYYTCHHNVLKHFKVEKTCKPVHNCKSHLKHSKCMFDILPSRLLCRSKMHYKKIAYQRPRIFDGPKKPSQKILFVMVK